MNRFPRFIITSLALLLLVLLPTLSHSDASVNVGGVEAGAAKAEDPDVSGVKANAEEFTFQAEVSRLMDIIINSLYSNRDVFLRELISNASDALDKIRFLSLSNKKSTPGDLEVRVRADKEKQILEISDTGVGMTRDDLIKNLGTIAKSGTAAFLKKATEAKDGSNLIGQFGVGFYSAYLVADRVTVTSKNDNDKQYVWESGAAQTFTIYEDTEGEQMSRGTKLTLHLKDDASEYLEEFKLKELIKKYSQFINFPIYLEVTEDVEVEIKEDEEEKEDGEKEEDATDKDESKDDADEEDGAKKEGDDEKTTEDDEDDIKVEDDDSKEGEEKKPKTRTEQRKKWDLVNEQKPIWTRDASEVTEEEYNSFFEGIAKLPGTPIAHTHFKGEGDIEFKSILYIPERPPVGLYSGNVDEEKEAIKLYVRRVLVSDKFEYSLLPRYLGFLVGIVDSDDIPINVSREMLQKSKTLDVIKRKLVRKALEMIKNLNKPEKSEEKDAEDGADSDEKEEGDEEKKDDDDSATTSDDESEDGEKKKSKKKKSKYIDFWTKFGKSIKLGIIEDRSNRGRLAKLLRYRSSRTDTDDAYDWASLDDYMGRMKSDQEYIYYHSGNDLESVKNSPFLEKLEKKGYEVLYLTEPIDEHMIMQLPDYEGTKFMSISKDNFKFGEEDQKVEDKKNKALKKRFKPLTKLLKDRMGEKVSKVKLSTRLSNTVCVVSTDQYGYSARMEIVMKAQAFADPDSFSYMTPKAKIMELNPNHPVVKEMLALAEQGDNDDKVVELGHLVYDTALIASGYLMNDNADYAKRTFKWIGESMGVDPDAPVEEFELPEEEEEEDGDKQKKADESDGDDDEPSMPDMGADMPSFEEQDVELGREEGEKGADEDLTKEEL